jgi:hypothetical protein
MIIILYSIASVRSIYYEHIDLFALIFFIAYTMQNFIVNIVDYLIFHKAMGYYDDVIFHEVFSYKLF